MKIAILGTRGIPNRYGGFEQAAEWLSYGLSERGHEVTVYNSRRHPYQQKKLGPVNIRHAYDPEHFLGTAGQFIYDLNCIRDVRELNPDVILFMGYTSSSIWFPLFPKNSLIISNMDGLEWKRSKYNSIVRRFLKHAEKLAVRHSHFHIADSPAIENYYADKYGIRCRYIPYAAVAVQQSDSDILNQLRIQPRNYFMLMARMEPENNIDVILDGFRKSGSTKMFLVVGNMDNRYGQLMIKKYGSEKNILFSGAQYNQEVVHMLRQHACIYFHGHSVGGTNPSLLEAMASGVPIAAHRNEFNEAVLGSDALYFSNAADIKNIIESFSPEESEKMVNSNREKTERLYNVDTVVDQYENYLLECYEKIKNEKTVPHRGWAYK